MLMAVTGGRVGRARAKGADPAGRARFRHRLGLLGGHRRPRGRARSPVVAPFRYARLVFSMRIGVVFLTERPDGLTLWVRRLIVASGLYAFARERARKRAFQDRVRRGKAAG